LTAKLSRPKTDNSDVNHQIYPKFWRYIIAILFLLKDL